MIYHKWRDLAGLYECSHVAKLMDTVYIVIIVQACNIHSPNSRNYFRRDKAQGKVIDWCVLFRINVD